MDVENNFDAVVPAYSCNFSNFQLSPCFDVDIGFLVYCSRTMLFCFGKALFDCELNAAHMELCAAAGVTHYPTLMFIGSGKFYDTDPFSKLLLGKQAAGMMGESPIPNTVKYQGNWQYFDSILDWIKAMQGLSRLHKWNTEGFGKRLRTFLLPRKKNNGQLPLGIPGGSASISGSSDGTAGASGTSGRDTSFLEAQVDKWKKSADDMTKVATRAATMMDTLLFSENYTDMFTFLDDQNAWNDVKTYENMDDIYRACVLETSIDYCQRLSDPVGTKVVDDLVASDLTSEELVAASDDIEKLILEALAKKEPYCAILDSCIRDGLKDPACRPKTCPFANDLACRMLTSCQDPSVIKEYADALKLDIDTLLPQAAASK